MANAQTSINEIINSTSGLGYYYARGCEYEIRRMQTSSTGRFSREVQVTCRNDDGVVWSAPDWPEDDARVIDVVRAARSLRY